MSTKVTHDQFIQSIHDLFDANRTKAMERKVNKTDIVQILNNPIYKRYEKVATDLTALIQAVDEIPDHKLCNLLLDEALSRDLRQARLTANTIMHQMKDEQPGGQPT